MDNGDRWRTMATAPRDGSRILVTIRPVEQGPAEVDVAYWEREDRLGVEGWRAADSHPGAVVGYAETELVCWMPLPGARPAAAPGAMPRPFDGVDEELGGSGI